MTFILDRVNFLCEIGMACEQLISGTVVQMQGKCDRLWNHKGEHRCSGEHNQKEEE